ncbi:MAG: BatA domain-containing protein, partial [Phycisphaerae bacterium]
MVAPASPAAVVTFGLPVLAWGAMAAAVPVLIHLVLRQRPRRQVLPTLRFLIAAHEASTRAHRLRRFLLLACRMAVILLVVGLLMKTGWAPTAGAPAAARVPANGPVSAVIAVDDSASMQYRYQGRTRLEDAVSWARNLLADPDRFPSGSEVAVVTGSTLIAPGVGWTRDFGAASRFLNGLGPEWHDRSAAALLRRAYGLIALGTRPRREVYLFTDLTEASWREPLPDPPAELARLIILDVGKTEDRNLALGLPELPAGAVPAERGSGGRVRVRSGRTDHAGTVLLEVDGQPRDRQSLKPLGTNHEISLN